MKRLAFATLIAIVFFGLHFAAEKRLVKSCEEINQSLEIAATQLKTENYNEALLHLRELKEKWLKNISFFSTVSGDDMLLAPSKDITAVYSCVLDKNYANALMLIRECQGYLEEIIDSHTLSAGNIL